MNGPKVISNLHPPRVEIQQVDLEDCQCQCHTTGSGDHCGACCDTCPSCKRRIRRVNGPASYLPKHRVRIVTIPDFCSGDKVTVRTATSFVDSPPPSVGGELFESNLEA